MPNALADRYGRPSPYSKQIVGQETWEALPVAHPLRCHSRKSKELLGCSVDRPAPLRTGASQRRTILPEIGENNCADSYASEFRAVKPVRIVCALRLLLRCLIVTNVDARSVVPRK